MAGSPLGLVEWRDVWNVRLAASMAPAASARRGGDASLALRHNRRHASRSAALRLHGDGGSERLYAVLPDGRLQALDGAGRRLGGGSGGALQPAGAAGP
ncbi:hypothetical protein QFW77_08735 [Luteimonas sp. RD2P54]|uniref:Uncharacterized protein n=1 Tax=Luteimonas endophytica TaxID=3042023 RepID=A0ABT6JA63_9GAMM|nr:hypothetical protein [Luteimonas endophytica]MDH5823073.1 hypothetical protein [Luteimonas endophytica]